MALIAANLNFAPAATTQDYRRLKEIELPDANPWTAMMVHADARRLYAAHGGRVEVIGLTNDAPVGALTDTPDVGGLALGAKLHLGYATSGKARSAHLFDLNTLRTTDKMRTGADPAAIVFEPGSQEIYAFNHAGRSVTIGEADDGDRLTTLDLGGQPYAAVVDTTEAKRTRILASLEDGNEVVVIDAVKHKVAARWLVAPAQTPRELIADPASHRLLVACGGQVLALDTGTGNVAATLALAGGVTSLAADPARQLLFCAGGDGSVAIVSVDGAGQLSVKQTLPAETGAAILAVDAQTHRLLIGTTPAGGTSKIAIYGE